MSCTHIAARGVDRKLQSRLSWTRYPADCHWCSSCTGHSRRFLDRKGACWFISVCNCHTQPHAPAPWSLVPFIHCTGLHLVPSQGNARGAARLRNCNPAATQKIPELICHLRPAASRPAAKARLPVAPAEIGITVMASAARTNAIFHMHQGVAGVRSSWWRALPRYIVHRFP